MSHRLLVPLAVVGSLGLAASLMPTLAEAAASGQGTTVHSITATSSQPAVPSPDSAGVRKVTAPAAESHYKRQATGAAGTDPNPDLTAEWTGGSVSALGVSLGASVTGYDTPTSAGLSATVDWGDGTSTNYASITTSPTFTHEYKNTGDYSLTLTVTDGAGDTSSETWSDLQTEGSEYTPYGPKRLLDTRKGIGAAAAPVAAKGVVKLQVNPPIPESYGVSAVVLNVTVTEATGNGFLSVYGDQDDGGTPTSIPRTSNLNFLTNQNVANLVIVPVGLNGEVDFYNGAPKGSVDVIADVQGYFSLTETNKFVNVAPTRILDTRKGIGSGTVKQIPADGNLTLTVAGAGKGVIPASGATAVAMNLTAVGGTRNGVITAYPAGESLPTVSNLNYSAGQTAANMAIVPVTANGQIVFHNNSNGPVDLIADATGYFAGQDANGGNAYVPYSTPIRDLDTRPNALQAGTVTPYPASVSWASSMVYNATVTEPTGNGYLALFPYNPNTPNALPTTSNLNYLANQTIPNLAIVPIGTVPDTTFDPAVYDIGIYLGGHGSADVILDTFGFFANQ